MTKNENDKNRVKSRKQKSGYYNRKVKQRKEIMTKSLKVRFLTYLMQEFKNPLSTIIAFYFPIHHNLHTITG